MSFAFTACLLILLGLAAIGMPIALAMILAAIGYVGFAGQNLSLPAEQMTLGLYDNFILLAVPLFIVAANIMNAGSISDRLLKFWLGRRRCGGAWQGHHRHDAQGRALSARLCRRDNGSRFDHRADHSALYPDGDVFAGFRRLHRRAFRGWHHPRLPDGADADDHELLGRAAPGLRPGRAGAGARAAQADR
jgi:hypothetical protein